MKQNLMRDSQCVDAVSLFPKTFCADTYEVFRGIVARVLHDGDYIDLGNRQLKVIHTPGHSPGHCCFYEEARGYLFSGDLIYKGCLDAFYPTTDPTAFLKSIQKVQGLNVSRILPGHHDLDIQVDIVRKIGEAFAELDRQGKLKQGVGVFEFEDFQIHL